MLMVYFLISFLYISVPEPFTPGQCAEKQFLLNQLTDDSNDTVLEMVACSQEFRCCDKCLQQPGCLSFRFDEDNNICVLYPDYVNASNATWWIVN